MVYKVVISPRARSDFESQYCYLAQRSPKGAANWALEFEKTITSLNKMPDRHGLAPENDDHEQEIHQAVFKTRMGNPYRILFLISDDQVHVLAIRGMGQSETGL